MEKMNEDEYMKLRVDDSISWYDAKSTVSKHYYNRAKAAQIVLSLIVPLLSGFANDHPVLNYIIGIIGFAVAIITGMLNLFKYQDKWTQYRTFAESLKREKFLFLTKAGIYNVEPAFDKLVARIEELIAKENNTWSQYIDEAKSKEKQG